MSCIAITYGYNQFSIFNTNVSTLPLIDNIISTCLEETHICLDLRLKSLTKELEDYNTEEENLRKFIKKLEGDKQKEEEKISADSQKSNEQKDTGKKQGNKRQRFKTDLVSFCMLRFVIPCTKKSQFSIRSFQSYLLSLIKFILKFIYHVKIYKAQMFF